ncbi:MAG: 1-phosphofructokinase family hexose kinase [Clostridia bacterium]|nr:1-phosphofructokinase family hexose kinase [Clostridia bacterium]
MKIITLTLNPAFDIHCNAPNLTLHRENLAEITFRDAGGKGINISRALIRNGVPSTAFVVIGEENGDLFRSCLRRDGVPYHELTVPGRIRENLTLHTQDADETRISFPGFYASDALIDQLEALLLPLLDNETVLTLTGRNPAGITMDRILSLLNTLKSKGGKIVIDSRSFQKEDLFRASPWLIKPNEEEIREYTNIAVKNLADAAEASRYLRSRGIENVMISLGAQGAVLASPNGVYLARAPKLSVRSTIGAGDSAIAGFLAALSQSSDPAEWLQNAVAFGSAACLTEGTRPPFPEDVEQLRGRITVEPLSDFDTN